MYPGDADKEWVGTNRGQLPCGSESVSMAFAVKRYSANITPSVTFVRKDKTISTNLNVPVFHQDDSDTPIIKPRGFILTNTTGLGILYSDNQLTLSLPKPEDYDGSKAYSKGDVVSYHHIIERPLLPDVDQHIDWIMVAKEDISAGSELDLSKWEVDEGIMQFEAFDQSRSYNRGLYVYIFSDTLLGQVFALFKSTTQTTADAPFDPSEWELVTEQLPIEKIYKKTIVSVIYDIGVM